MPASRFILLGASNAARGCLALVDAARAAVGGPVEVHAALGRGRSYGIPSRLLIRRLGGIDASPLWQRVADAPPLPTTALVMDVGNDLFYGVQVPRILAWVEHALQRLAPFAGRRLLAGLPLASLQGLTRTKYELFRRVLVPSCRLTLAEGLAAAAELHEGLRRLAAAHGVTFVTPAPGWYGVDPIHVRRRHWPEAAARLLDVSGAVPSPTPRCDTWGRRLSFCFAAPAERSWCGVPQRGAQPARTCRDGSSISLW